MRDPVHALGWGMIASANKRGRARALGVRPRPSSPALPKTAPQAQRKPDPELERKRAELDELERQIQNRIAEKTHHENSIATAKAELAKLDEQAVELAAAAQESKDKLDALESKARELAGAAHEQSAKTPPDTDPKKKAK